jgi:hypothetical protein
MHVVMMAVWLVRCCCGIARQIWRPSRILIKCIHCQMMMNALFRIYSDLAENGGYNCNKNKRHL